MPSPPAKRPCPAPTEDFDSDDSFYDEVIFVPITQEERQRREEYSERLKAEQEEKAKKEAEQLQGSKSHTQAAASALQASSLVAVSSALETSIPIKNPSQHPPSSSLGPFTNGPATVSPISPFLTTPLAQYAYSPQQTPGELIRLRFEVSNKEQEKEALEKEVRRLHVVKARELKQLEEEKDRVITKLRSQLMNAENDLMAMKFRENDVRNASFVEGRHPIRRAGGDAADSRRIPSSALKSIQMPKKRPAAPWNAGNGFRETIFKHLPKIARAEETFLQMPSQPEYAPRAEVDMLPEQFLLSPPPKPSTREEECQTLDFDPLTRLLNVCHLETIVNCVLSLTSEDNSDDLLAERVASTVRNNTEDKKHKKTTLCSVLRIKKRR